MKQANVDTLRSIMKDLMQLGGISVSSVAVERGIQRTNLSSFLNGRNQVFSDQKLQGMLAHLGVLSRELFDGTLILQVKPEVLFRWRPDDAVQVQSLLTALIGQEGLNESECRYLQDAKGEVGCHLLRIKNADGRMIPVLVKCPGAAVGEAFGAGIQIGLQEVSHDWLDYLWSSKKRPAEQDRHEQEQEDSTEPAEVNEDLVDDLVAALRATNPDHPLLQDVRVLASQNTRRRAP